MFCCKISIKEEDRLAIVVENIIHDVAVVPRGAYVRTSLGQVHKNKSFAGKCICFQFFFLNNSFPKLLEQSLDI